MSAQKKWLNELSEIESILHSSEKYDENFMIQRFESIDEEFRDLNYPHLYLKFWPSAKSSGNLKLANFYAKKSLEYLVALKRIPKIKLLIVELKNEGMLRSELEDYQMKCQILLGSKVVLSGDNIKYFDLMDDHPAHWRNIPGFIKQYLSIGSDWDIQEWKFCYEFILKNKFDKDIYLRIMENAFEKNRSEVMQKIENLFQSKKIQYFKT